MARKVDDSMPHIKCAEAVRNLASEPFTGFPEGFLWGAALSAKQYEGADGRGLTVADIQDYDPGKTGGARGDLSLQEIEERLDHPERFCFPKKIGIEGAARFKEDLSLLGALGLKAFRFSLSWSRIFPQGDDERPDEAGLAFYDQVIDCALHLGMQPIVTIYHDDMPISLALRHNGFLSSEVCDAYLRFAQTALDHYGDRVRWWIPFNQPNLTRIGLSSLGIVRDQVQNLEEAKVQALHNKLVLGACVAAYGRAKHPDAHFGAMLADFLVDPLACRPDDVLLATRKNQLTMYATADVQLRGRYPGYYRRSLADRGISLQVSRRDLDILSDNTLDFLAVSYYNSNVVEAGKNGMAIGDALQNPYLAATPWGWTINETGLLDHCLKYWDRYGVPIMVAENGIGEIETLGADQTVHDSYRIDYMRRHMLALEEALRQGVDVFAYCCWSPLDMVSSGTSEMKKRYGLVYVDQDEYGRGTHGRYPKDSYAWYREAIASNGRMLRDGNRP